ncbi:MAG: DUF4190 domain-containing protein [Acetatifactor sp.]|nr:DUF4190 domain-containing protein [Acetatifactor sp.]
MDYNQNDPFNRQENFHQSPFTIAALACGICSLVLCCTGILAVPLGALGILFTVLARQRGKRMSSLSITGLVLSIIGLVLGLILSICAIGIYLSDPDYSDSFDNGYWNDYYDDDNDYFFDDFYNYGFENL